MRSAFLNIIDEVNCLETNIMYKFYKVSTYAKILKDLHIIYPKYRSIFKASVTYHYMDNSFLIENYDKYLLAGDRISIRISYSFPIYFLFDVISTSIIKKSRTTEELYNFFLQNLYMNSDCELLMYQKTGMRVRLIDVLDSPIHHQNRCIDRLIKKYNY